MNDVTRFFFHVDTNNSAAEKRLIQDLLVDYHKLLQPPERPTVVELGFSLVSFDFIVSTIVCASLVSMRNIAYFCHELTTSNIIHITEGEWLPPRPRILL